ncbi:hypothetical protein RsTz2092_02500 [Deferribacterales bacterium RsTz2092]|nr:hypothetical protein AGMMS49941_08540 [Deferribacterales bacterium]
MLAVKGFYDGNAVRVNELLPARHSGSVETIPNAFLTELLDITRRIFTI